MTTIARLDAGNLFFLGDVHGCWWRVERLFRVAGWTGAEGLLPPPGTCLIQVGDLIDRGKKVAAGRDLHLPPRPDLPARVTQLTATQSCPPAAPPPSRIGGPPVPLIELARGEVPWPSELIAHQQRLLSHACDSVETVRYFMGLESRCNTAGARLVCLVGNHEADLIRGNFCHARRQKIYFLALLGLEAEAIEQHATVGVAPPLLRTLAPELAWLLDRPLMALAKGVLAVHGGPVQNLVLVLDALGIPDLDTLAQHLEEARDAGYDHPLTREGGSILSPGPGDDAVRRPALARRMLDLAEAHTLALGHSPFLHYPRGRWVDIDDPAVRTRLETPAFLGREGEIIKLDTDMKRGGPAWLVSWNSAKDAWTALREDGWKQGLERPETPRPSISALEGGIGRLDTLPEPAPEGVDGDEWQSVQGALESLEASGRFQEAEQVRRRLGFLLHAGLTDLAVIAEGLHWRGRPFQTWLEWLESWCNAVEARLHALAAQLETTLRNAGGGEVLFVLPPGSYVIQGRFVHLLPAVVQAVLCKPWENLPKQPVRVAGVGYLTKASREYLRIQVFGRRGDLLLESMYPLEHWPPDPTQVEQKARKVLEQAARSHATVSPFPASESSGGVEPPVGGSPRRRHKVRVGGPVTDPVVQQALETWGRAAFSSRGADCTCWQALGADGRLAANRYLVCPTLERCVPVLQVGGVYLPANTAFTDPGRRYPVVTSGPDGPRVLPIDHATWLFPWLPGDPVYLYSAVSEQVAGYLQQGAVEQVGLAGARRPRWQRGRYLFLSPEATIGCYFFHKAVTLAFEIPRDRLESAVISRLVTVNLFLSDGGEVLDPEARFGAPDVGLEVVALGTDGVSWVIDYLRR